MTPELDQDTLQRYYDGELSPAEERAVRARVQDDPRAQAQLAKLARLSELMQTAVEELGDELNPDAMFADIEAGIERQQAAGFGERFRVITGEAVEHRRSVVVPLLAACAVAAAAVLAVFAPGGPKGGPQAARQAPAQVHGSQVEDVDFGDNTGTVFTIESQGIATAVVWIADEPNEQDAGEGTP